MTENQPPKDQLFVPFLLKHHENALVDIMRNPDLDAHYGVPVSLARLAAADHGLADVLVANPRSVLPFLDSALLKAQEALMAQSRPDRHLLSQKENVHARICGPTLHLDAAAKAASPGIGGLGSAHIDKAVTVRGTVVRTGAVKMLEARRLYECGKCRHRFVVGADLEVGATVQLPSACPSRKDKPCKGTNFRHCEEVALYTNFQEIQVQEGRQCLALGAAPRALTVLLQDELADACQVGDDVDVCGVVIRQFGAMNPGVRCQVSLALQATAIAAARDRRAAAEVPLEAAAAFAAFWEAQRAAGRPLEGRNKIVAAMCPQLCGLFGAKLSALLMLLGGVPRQEPGGGGHVRGELHLLLVGDPGTGKSQFQKYVARLSPRAVLASGCASSAAGLTAAAVRDGGGWTLEAGALVLADGGVCCIDEFDSVREADRAALHEAMEQQTCSVAKAGLVTTLHTRAAVFGTCNPRGHRRYNPRRALGDQLNLSGPLLSRFDLVLLLLDDANPAWDAVVADHVLAAHQQRPDPGSNGPSPPTQARQRAAPRDGEGWTLETLRQYIAWCKATFSPALTPEAEEVLAGYYHLRRGAGPGRAAARTTARMLDSLVRVAQAHARLMARHQVTLQDAVVAVSLMESCAVDGDTAVLGLSPGSAAGAERGGFPDAPDREYQAAEAAVLAAVRAGPTGGLLPWGDEDGGGGGAGGGWG